MRPIALVMLLAGLARAATGPTVAVMPFKDLSGGKGNVGEAIRETVTSDLKDVPNLRVIERGRIDQVLAEQNLQANKSELDAATTVKVGKLLGASLIVTGAYQKASSSVRLTARFVKVETGEVTGTAKVDGGSSDFLHLQDKITVELLKSAGIESKQVQKFTGRARPKLKSMRPIELYGDAIVEPDDGKKKQLLLAALNEDPTFVYATRDLDALEDRLKSYDKNIRAAQEKAIREMREAIGNENDPAAYMKAMQLMGTLAGQQRWRALISQARVLEKSKIKAPMAGTQTVQEMASFYILNAYYMLHEHDNFLRDGEKYLAAYPGSMMAGSVRNWMQDIVNQKRQVFEGQQEVANAVNQMEPAQRADLCMVALKYNEHKQFREALRLFETCLSSGKPTLLPRASSLQVMMVIAQQAGDYAAARRYMAMLEKEDKKTYDSMKLQMQYWPKD
jgi:TolB-like protein